VSGQIARQDRNSAGLKSDDTDIKVQEQQSIGTAKKAEKVHFSQNPDMKKERG
jgi:hypothetical protein